MVLKTSWKCYSWVALTHEQILFWYYLGSVEKIGTIESVTFYVQISCTL